MAEDMTKVFEEMMRQTQRDYDALDMPVQKDEIEVEEVMLSMEDGVRLQTFVFRTKRDKESNKKLPVILQRSPYYHAWESYQIHGKNLAMRGFAYIVQFCRGTGNSEGVWEPNVNERQDGLATLQWINEMDWVDSIGYWGDSYLALTGWCIADIVPDKVKGMYLGVYGTDRFTSAYQKRLFRHDVLTSWAMENAGYEVTADYVESCKYRPHIEVDEKLWGKKLPWYRNWITADTEENAYWQQDFWQMLRDIPKKVEIPILITEGWYDHHLGSALKSYETLNQKIKEHCSLMIGSWNHYSLNCLAWSKPEHLENCEVKSMVEWFQTLLVKHEIPPKKVSFYVIGEDTWKNCDTWPIPTIGKKIYYFHEKHNDTYSLTMETDEIEHEILAEYDYDPENPVPSLGGESMLKSMDKVGSMYQPKPGFRPDVISFISEPVKKEYTIGGKIRVYLQVMSDCEDTAFTAKVMELREDGTAVNIRSSITTIQADHLEEDYQPGTVTDVTIDMWDIAWKVCEGSRIRVDISSSDFPQYAVHSNYKGTWSMQEKSKTAHQCICRGSYIELPMI